MPKRIVILRTSPETIGNVVANAKYALNGELKGLNSGDLILISQKVSTVPDGKPIRYLMQFVRCYPDGMQESDRIWGRHWKYMVECRDCRPLRRPFNIRTIQVTKKNYAQGGTVVYLDSRDTVVLENGGYLEVTTSDHEFTSPAPLVNVRKPHGSKASVAQDIHLLERLDQLKQSGALTEEEFRALKGKVLSQ